MDNHSDLWKLIVGVTVSVGGCLILIAAVIMAFMCPFFINRR